MAIISFRGHAFPSTVLYSATHTEFGNRYRVDKIKDDEITFSNAKNSHSSTSGF